MTPENQVPTQATSQALADAEIKFDSYFSWYTFEDLLPEVEITGSYLQGLSAPTAQELLEKMPSRIENVGYLESTTDKPDHTAAYVYLSYGGLETTKSIRHKNLAEALAQMCLWLKEKGYL